MFQKITWLFNSVKRVGPKLEKQNCIWAQQRTFFKWNKQFIIVMLFKWAYLNIPVNQNLNKFVVTRKQCCRACFANHPVSRPRSWPSYTANIHCLFIFYYILLELTSFQNSRSVSFWTSALNSIVCNNVKTNIFRKL